MLDSMEILTNVWFYLISQKKWSGKWLGVSMDIEKAQYCLRVLEFQYFHIYRHFHFYRF